MRNILVHLSVPPEAPRIRSAPFESRHSQKKIPISDRTSSDPANTTLHLVLLSLRKGVEKVIEIDNKGKFPFHGMRLDLLHLEDHPIDLKPEKYSLGI
ncbi:hypothetical protein [Leptospira stimsonii]|uniref:Uncharacterized protein n=1 Tax=Leptospira stimsonii TaxID=2202203 RepID=A0ABY2N393_9LEPT|nr:hypothetical protein [Leptospira stimsonii]TGK26107.1 hypothetical protein EHO98_00895 [Leptospira stimsonii]TGM14935.1 hypothetical protein EHQ90_10685 [Leptospira stimsonii]